MTRKIGDWGGNIAAFAGVVIVNGLANALPIAGTTTGAVSDKYSSLFTPAGFTFAIWGVIYLLLFAFVVYQALPAQRRNDTLAAIGPWFKTSCAANMLWLITWHLEWLAVTLVLMIVLLASLVGIYRRLANQSWIVQLPFSAYTAWVTVAAIANASAVQTALELNAFLVNAETWTLLKLAAAVAIGAVVGLARRDAVFPLVVAWATWGIAAGQATVATISGAATAMCFTMLAIAGYVLVRRGTTGFLPRTVPRGSGSTRGNRPRPNH